MMTPHVWGDIMRIKVITASLGIAALALTGCAGQAQGYTVAHRTEQNGTGSVDLILPDATTEQARDAIRDHADGIQGPELYYLKVVHTEDASRYVCRARWYRDATSYDAHSNHTTKPDAWPHLAITCP